MRRPRGSPCECGEHLVGGALMARPHIETIHALDVPEADFPEGALAGARRRVLSTDDTDGSYTALVSVPAGFAADLAPGRPYELFVLQGEVTVGSERVATGIYAYAPGATDERRLASSR